MKAQDIKITEGQESSRFTITNEELMEDLTGDFKKAAEAAEKL